VGVKGASSWEFSVAGINVSSGVFTKIPGGGRLSSGEGGIAELASCRFVRFAIGGNNVQVVVNSAMGRAIRIIRFM
jgi:hypothetical protein